MKKAIAIGLTIKKLREERGMSQDELADLSNTSRRYMSAIELAKSNPSLKKIQQIAATLEMKTWELIKIAEEETNRGEEKNCEDRQ